MAKWRSNTRTKKPFPIQEAEFRQIGEEIRPMGIEKRGGVDSMDRPNITTFAGKTYTWEDWHEGVVRPSQEKYGLSSPEEVLTPGLALKWTYDPVGGEDGLVHRWISKEDPSLSVEVVPFSRESDEEGESFETDYMIYPARNGRGIWDSPEIKSGDDLTEGLPGALRYAQQIIEQYTDNPESPRRPDF